MRGIVIAATGLLVLGPALVHAQGAEAEQRFKEAEALLSTGKVAEACDAFEASNRIESRAGTLINIGLCKEKLGKLASALVAYRGALDRVKDPKKKAVALERVAALEPRVSQLTIAVAPEARALELSVSLDGAPIDAATYDHPISVDGGSHAITARAPGHRRWSTTIQVAPERTRVSVIVPGLDEEARSKEPRPGPASAPRPAPSGPRAPDPEPARRDASTRTGRRKAAIALGVAGLGLIGGGVALGLSAWKLEADAFALCPDPGVPCGDAPRAADLLGRGNERALLANMAYAAGGAAVVGAAVLWLTGGPRREASLVTLIAPSGGIGVAIRRRLR